MLEDEYGLIAKLDTDGANDGKETASDSFAAGEEHPGHVVEEQERDPETTVTTAETVEAPRIARRKAPRLTKSATLRSKLVGRRKERVSLQLGSLSVLLYLSCLYCHVPILLSDLHRWTLQGKIPYLAAYTSLSEATKSKLFKHSNRKFESMIRPRASRVA